jgi:hypothetical protein
LRSKWAVALIAVVVASPLSAEGPPVLQQQAAELRDFAIAELEAWQPEWSRAQRESAAAAFYNAVVGHGRALTEGLTEGQVQDLRLVVTRAARSGPHRVTPEGLAHRAAVTRWFVTDILTHPPPDPVATEQLKAQVEELARSLEQELLRKLPVDRQTAAAAAQHALAKQTDRVEHPYHRFDRVPLSVEELDLAHAVLQRRIEERAGEVSRELRRWEGSSFRVGDPPAHSLASSALASAVAAVRPLRWPSERIVELGGQAQVPEGLALYCLPVARRLNRLLYAVMGGIAAPEPVAGSPSVAPSLVLSQGELEIVRKLRGGLGSAGAEHSGRVTVPLLRYDDLSSAMAGTPRPLPRQGSPMELRLRYRATADGLSAELSPISQPQLTASLVPESGARYELKPGTVRLFDLAGPLRDTYVPRPDPGAVVPAVSEVRLDPPPAAGPYLLALAKALEPSAYEWQRLSGPGTDPAIELYEARLKEPAKVTEPHEVAALRYWYDTRRRAVARVVFYDRNTNRVAETVYHDWRDLPDGWQVALRSTMKVAPGDAPAAIGSGEDRVEGFLHMGAISIETEYRWFPQARVRLPLRREITDEDGRIEAEFEFFDHKVEPVETD